MGLLRRIFDRKRAIPSRWTLFFLMLISIYCYFSLQGLVGSLPPPLCGIDDQLQIWTAGLNSYLHAHPYVANGLMIAYGVLGDLSVVILFVFMVLRTSCRPLLPLFLFTVLRLIMQLLVSLPVSDTTIWHYPGFPSLFIDYHTFSDFYFSAYVGINLLLTLYLLELRIKWLTAVGLVIVLFAAFVDIILRSHYTTDIYTSVITAVFCFLATQKLAPYIDSSFRKVKSYRYYLIAVFLLGFVAYSFVQRFISAEEVPTCDITDLVHTFVFPLTNYISTHGLENIVLIVLNFISDCLVLSILAITLFKRDIRPFLTMVIFFSLRQILQLLIKLPMPPHIIWHYPGFPSIMQTYGVASDLFFSGHTGSSLIAAYEFSYFRKRWLTILGFAIFAFESSVVLILQAHYTMDVFTAIMTVTCFTKFSFKVSPYVNRFLFRLIPS